MKRIVNYLMVVAAFAAGLMFTGCAKEFTEPTTNGGGRKTITFNIPITNKGTITYAPVVTQDGEANLKHLDIYMFDDATKKLEWIFKHGSDDLDFTEGTTSNDATIDVTERSGKKVFFFVGNGDAISSKLKAARFGETTIAQFQDMISDKQTELPVTPLLMTAMTTIEDLDDVQDAEKTIKLKRRVARFDIDNDESTGADATNFKITSILIGKVNMHGYFFDNAARTAEPMATANIPAISFGSGTGHNEGETPAVFYTYPTTIGDGKTEISFEGEFFGEKRIYTLTADADVEIEANKRYILKAKKITPTFVAFEVRIEEWGEGDDMQAEPNVNEVYMLDLKVKSGNGTLNATNKTLEMTGKNETVLSFTAKSFHKDGTKVEILYRHGTKAAMDIEVTNQPPVLTYNAYYATPYEVKVKAQSLTIPIDALVELVSIADPRERVAIRVTSMPNYTGSLKPVLVGGIYWAPVNVGSTTINTSSAYGQFFQWGRNQAHASTGTVATHAGPVAPDQIAAAGTKFITIPPESYTFDWLDPQDDGLWSGDKRRGPCPAGWRVPNSDEFGQLVKIFNADDTKVAFGNQAMSIKGDDGTSLLYFPLAGYRYFKDGSLATPATGKRGLYFSADTYKTSAYAFDIYETPPAGRDKLTLGNGHARGHAFSIRCVADE